MSSGATRPTRQQITVAGKSLALRALGAVPRSANFTADSVADPAALARMLLEMQQGLTEGIAIANSLPFAGGTWIRGVAFVAGVTKVLVHGLGRPYRGFIATRIQASTSTYPYEIAQAPVALNAQTISLAMNQTCTVDLLVF